MPASSRGEAMPALTCSVVLATYNGAAYLPAQLESIAAQSRPPDELIVSDDGSTDATLDIVTAFAQAAPFPVGVLAGPREGCAENFWRAAKLAGGDAIAWSDQDDVWHPDKLARCLAALAGHGASMVTHSAAVVGPDLAPLGRNYPGYRQLRVLEPLQGDPLHVPSGFATVFRRALLAELDWEGRPISHQHQYQVPHDHAVALWAFGRHRRVELPDVLAQYRQHGGNLAGAPPGTGVAELRAALSAAGAQYQQLAERMAGYAQWFERAYLPAAGRYFRRAAERALLRSRLREEGPVGARWATLAASARAGTYRAPYRGGLGARALASDLASLGLATGAGAAARLGLNPGVAGR